MSVTGFPPTRFTRPLLGVRILTETEARDTGKQVLVARMSLSDVARVIENDESAGHMKRVVDGSTKEMPGAAILRFTVSPTLSKLVFPIQSRNGPCLSIRGP